MNLAMTIGTNRHYVVDTITVRHFVQTARASGLPGKMVVDLSGELHNPAAASINKARTTLLNDFPENAVTGSYVKLRPALVTSSSYPIGPCVSRAKGELQVPNL